MRKENPFLPCMFDPTKACDCPLKPQNAESLNELGNRDRMIRSAIQRQGYDRVSPGLIKELLVNPHGGFFTEAFNKSLPFSPEMLGIRRLIVGMRRIKLRELEQNQTNPQCPHS